MTVRTVLVGNFTNCYLLIDDETKKAAVIDPGFDAALILKETANLDVCYILLTHAHFDHVSAVPALLAATQAKLAAHKEASELLLHPENNVSRMFGALPPEPIVPDVILEDGGSVMVGGLTVRALHTPGHTKGDCCLFCEDALFSGDTLFLGEVGRTDLPGGSYSTLMASLQKLKAVEGDYRVYPGHGPATQLDWERRNNPYMNQVDYDSDY